MKERKWWKDAVVYQVYPKTFCDSNGDGVGDIKGITSKLDYLADLGIDVIWLSPVYKSPMEDNGYDISDYYDINPMFGTMEDMDELIAEAKKRKIRIIMDLVINHTSSEHEWFKLSRQGVEPYKDYYYWSDKPNNWTGFFGGKTWEYDEMRGQYYLHLFAPGQPDLNYYCPEVLEEVKKILRFWLDKGIVGFRCDVINIIWKDSLANGKPSLILTGSEHYLTLDGTHKILRELNDIFEEYDAMTVGETVFVDTKDAWMLTAPERHELSMVFGFEHMETDQIIVKWFRTKFHWSKFMKVIDKWQREVPWNTIYLENHDQPRSISRFGDESDECAKLMATLLLTLKATPFIYQGEERGMKNLPFKCIDDIEDVESKNVYKILRGLHIPHKFAWKCIMGGSRQHARAMIDWSSNNEAIHSYYKEMIKTHHENSELRNGDFQLLETSDEYSKYRRGKMIIQLNHSSDSHRGLAPWETKITRIDD